MGSTNWKQMRKEATATLEGDFTVVITETSVKKTGTGKDKISCKMKVESGPFAGRVVFNDFIVSPESPNAMRMFFQHLAVLGLDDDFFDTLPDDVDNLPIIANALKNRRGVVTMGTEKYQGQDRERVKGWKPAEGGSGLGASLGFDGGLSGMTAGSVSSPVPATPAVPAAVPSFPTASSAAPAAPLAEELEDPF